MTVCTILSSPRACPYPLIQNSYLKSHIHIPERYWSHPKCEVCIRLRELSFYVFVFFCTSILETRIQFLKQVQLPIPNLCKQPL